MSWTWKIQVLAGLSPLGIPYPKVMFSPLQNKLQTNQTIMLEALVEALIVLPPVGRPIKDTLVYTLPCDSRIIRSPAQGTGWPSTAAAPCLASSTSSYSPLFLVLSLPVSVPSCSASILHPASGLFRPAHLFNFQMARAICRKFNIVGTYTTLPVQPSK